MSLSKSFFFLLLLTFLYACREATVYVAADWCVANPNAPVANQQKDIDVLCNGAVNCSSIQPGGSCFKPNTVRDHASVVFNRYYKERNSNPTTCNFGGDAKITSANPSHGSCVFE